MINKRISDLGPGFVLLLIHDDIDEKELDYFDDEEFPLVCANGTGSNKPRNRNPCVYSTRKEALIYAKKLSSEHPKCVYIVCRTDDVYGPDFVPLYIQFDRSKKNLERTLELYVSTIDERTGTDLSFDQKES